MGSDSILVDSIRIELTFRTPSWYERIVRGVKNPYIWYQVRENGSESIQSIESRREAQEHDFLLQRSRGKKILLYSDLRNRRHSMTFRASWEGHQGCSEAENWSKGKV